MFRTRRSLLGIGVGLVLALAQVEMGAAHATQPILMIDDAYLQEGGATYVRVYLDHACYESVTVNYTTVDGTAEGGPNYLYDYKPVSGTLTFSPGETSKSIRIGSWDDRDREPEEYFFVTLSGARGATIANDTAQVGLADNDGPTAP